MQITKYIIFSLAIVSCLSLVENRETSIQKKLILNQFMNGNTKQLFKVWHLIFNKEYNYNTEEGIQKYKNFKANVQKIKEHNAKGKSYNMALHHMSDLTYEEFKNYYHLKEIKPKQMKKFIDTNFVSLDDYEDEDDDEESNDVDKKRKAVSWESNMQAVRNQGSCGSCWAFTTMSVIEGQIAISKTIDLTGWLSTQQLVDCDSSNNGCDGGWFEGAIDYFKDNGPTYDSDYLYEAEQKACRYVADKALPYRVKKFKSATNANRVYNFLKKGPVAVAIDANDDFMNYSSGIWDAECSTEVNHAVTLVGYGVEGKVGYWIIRNSWGEDWGLKGHIWVKENASNSNSCNIELYGYIPVEKKQK